MSLTGYPLTDEEQRSLLRRFEPIVRYDRAERFLPMDVGRYVERCSMWVTAADGRARPRYSRGELDLERLAEIGVDEPSATFFLRLEPLDAAAAPPAGRIGPAAAARGTGRPTGQGRLARVGYHVRLVDAAYAIALLTRDRVPSGRAAAAAAEYARLRAENHGHGYYGRVTRQSGWLVLQYWLFYLFDDWRSAFAGANDHDADWEMIAIYLGQMPGGSWRGEWVAASCHDHAGAILLRPWDDPELSRLGDHPIVWAGAGSHAGYFAPGEYLSEIELPFLRPLSAAVDRWREVWYRHLRQYRPAGDSSARERAGRISAPFVDYARGGGPSIGPYQTWTWNQVHLIDPPPAWVGSYRGLWGWYSRDPFAAESAPAGPMYNRDGTPRRSWYDPVGWAGLDRVLPRAQAIAMAEERIARDDAIRQELARRVDERERELREVSVELATTEGWPQLRPLRAALETRITEIGRDVARLRMEMVTADTRRRATVNYVSRLRDGRTRPAGPVVRRTPDRASDERRAHRLADVWAALSVGLLLIGIVGLELFAGPGLIPGIVLLVALFAVVESVLHGGLTRLVGNVTVGLALAAAALLAYAFFWWLLALAILLIGSYVLWGNLRELWSYRSSRWGEG